MRNIVVIGASSGIGLQAANKLAGEADTKVYAFARSERPDALNDSVEYSSLDVTDDELSFDLPDGLHGLVYCPGTINLKPFHRLKLDEFREEMEINAFGAVKVIQELYRALKKSGNASVVLFSTVAVQTGMGFHASIAMAKGAVEGLTRSLASEYAANNIRFNAIAPSLTDTPLADRLLADEKKQEASAKRHPLNRVGTADEMAELAVYLLSDKASWMTGQVIGLDGGIGSTRGI